MFCEKKITFLCLLFDVFDLYDLSVNRFTAKVTLANIKILLLCRNMLAHINIGYDRPGLKVK